MERAGSGDTGGVSSEVRAPQAGAEVLAEPLRSRWSPSVFDPTHEVSAAEIEALLRAAQWAPSAGNSQPWSLIVCPRGSAAHERLVGVLSRGNSGWVPRASVVLVSAAHVVQAPDGDEPSPYARYDTGQAAAHVTLQARAMGLHAHQFAGFDKPAFAQAMGVPATHEVLSGIAVGVPGDPDEVDERTAERDHRPRTRRDLAQWAFGEEWGQPWKA